MEKFPISFIPDIPNSPPNFGKELPKFHVYLHDCDCHSPDMVECALHYLVGLPKHIAQQKMMGAHMLGKTLVGTWHQEAAEYYFQRLNDVPGYTGMPLKVTIEKA